MADQNTGGDFSVAWSIDVDNSKKNSTDDSGGTGGGKHHQHGIDEDGAIGDWFTISIRVPECFADAESYLTALKGNDDTWSIQTDPKGDKRVFFDLQIEQYTPDQIRVSWGKSGNVIRPPFPILGKKKPVAASGARPLAKKASTKKANKKSAPKKKVTRKGKRR
jgi:hypothetical protein